MSSCAARSSFIALLSVLLFSSPSVRPRAVAQDAPSETAKTPTGGDAAKTAGSATPTGAAQASPASTAGQTPGPQTGADSTPAGQSPVVSAGTSVRQSPSPSSTSGQSPSRDESGKIPRPLRAGEVMALQAGGGLPANVVDQGFGAGVAALAKYLRRRLDGLKLAHVEPNHAFEGAE